MRHSESYARNIVITPDDGVVANLNHWEYDGIARMEEPHFFMTPIRRRIDQEVCEVTTSPVGAFDNLYMLETYALDSDLIKDGLSVHCTGILEVDTIEVRCKERAFLCDVCGIEVIDTLCFLQRKPEYEGLERVGDLYKVFNMYEKRADVAMYRLLSGYFGHDDVFLPCVFITNIREKKDE